MRTARYETWLVAKDDHTHGSAQALSHSKDGDCVGSASPKLSVVHDNF